VAFDVDADRLGVVDNLGNVISNDDVLVLLSRDLLKENKGAKIVFDIKCSSKLYKDILIHEGVPILWKTGHSLIKDKMVDEGAPLAGELSGHFFTKPHGVTDDGVYTAVKLCLAQNKNYQQ
jgi:phosphomannomutase